MQILVDKLPDNRTDRCLFLDEDRFHVHEPRCIFDGAKCRLATDETCPFLKPHDPDHT